jgi:parallel beta-helix repeat protein
MKTFPLLIILLAALALPALAAEPLRYSGEETLFQDTVWEGEVLIDGILTVPPGTTLEIRPGTVVRLSRLDSNGDGIGERELFVQGTLRALGTAAEPILFTSAEEAPVPGDWGAINMMASEEDNVLSHCTVEYAYRGFHAHFARGRLSDVVFRYNVRGLQFQESTVSLSDCTVEDNLNGLQFRNSEVTLERLLILRNDWGLRCVYSELTMRDCRFEDNLINGANFRDSTVLVEGCRFAGNRKGLYLQRSRGTVRGSTLLENSEHGIFLEDSQCDILANRVAGNGRAGVKWVDSAGIFQNNSLVNNGEYALINDGDEGVDARGNWWGTSSVEAIAILIRDGSDRTGLGLVDAGDPLSGPVE